MERNPIINHRLTKAYPGPKFIAGDFNQEPGMLPAVQELESEGWADVQTIAYRLWNVSPSVTCKGKTRKDYLYLSPDAIDLVQRVWIQHDRFPDHAILGVELAMPGRSDPIPRWPKPSCIDYRTIGKVVDAGFSQWGTMSDDQTEKFQSIWHAHEQQVDHTLKNAGKPGLLPKQRGRAQHTQVEYHTPQVAAMKPSREGEPTLNIAGPTLQLKRWFLQLRRLINLGRCAPAGPEPPTPHAIALYHKIMHAPGFLPTFAEWWTTRPIPSEQTPAYLPGEVPHKQLVQAIANNIELHVRHLETMIKNDRLKQARSKHQTNANAVFQDVKGEGTKPVETLLEVTQAVIVDIPDETTVVLDRQAAFVEGLPILGGATPIDMVIQSGDQVWFAEDHEFQIGQTITQRRKLGTLDELFCAFGNEWSKRWDKHKDIPDSQWEHIVGFIDLALPTKQMQDTPLTSESFDHTLRMKSKHAAPGLDGITRSDLLHMTPTAKQEVVEVLKQCERGKGWPEPLVHGSVHSLQKTADSFEVGQFRPITILPITYRTWASLRGRQLLNHLSELVPVTLCGNVSGRSATDVWYHMQSLLETNMLDNTPACGAIADVCKAFNCLPRWPILRAAVKLGVTPGILRAWVAHLTQLRRHFIVRQSCGPPLGSHTGFAEGCSLSVCGMLITNVILHRYFQLAHPSIKLWSYVDNWEVSGHDLQAVRQALNRIEGFAGLLDLQLDQRKSILWSQSATDRAVLRADGVPITHSVRDLGGHLMFSAQQTNSTLTKKCEEIKPIWGRLARIYDPKSCKMRVIRAKAWASALHAGPGVFVADHTLTSLRAGALKGLGYTKAGVNPMLFLALSVHPAHDPECHLLISGLRAFRRHYSQDFISAYAKEIASTPVRLRKPGPIAVMWARVEQLGWVHQDAAVWITPDNIVVDLLHTPFNALHGILCRSFQTSVAQKLASRKGFEGLH